MELLAKQTPGRLKNCPAPAKLNLFLHVTGRREDGYHLLESVFQLTDLCDYLDFSLREDDKIVCHSTCPSIPQEEDLVFRAASLLKEHALREKGLKTAGIDMVVRKHIPMGAGLGGGSSDAATTLLALNHLWQCGFSRAQLADMGLMLGADVPFFLLGQNALVRGIGEKLTPIVTPERWFVVLKPPVSVPTASIFRADDLTRDTEPLKMQDFPDFYSSPEHFGRNDLQPVAARIFPEIAQALDDLNRFGPAKMTGSGSCVFAGFASREHAASVAAELAGRWDTKIIKGLQDHPLRYLLDIKGE